MFTWFSGSQSRPPILLKLRSSKAFIVLTVTNAIFTDVFVYAVPIPYLPFALTTRSHVDPQNIQTWISVFLATFCIALIATSPFFGWLADRLESRRSPLLAGLIALAGSNVMLCLGRSIPVLITARALQGASSTIVWVVALALLVDTVGVEGVGQAMGWVGMGMSLALLLAPLFGGIVFARAGYYAVFAMVFGLIALDILMRVVMIERKVAITWLKDEEVVTSTGAEEIHGSTEEVMAEKQTDEKVRQTSTADVEIGSTNDQQGLQAGAKRRLPVFLVLLSSLRILSGLYCCMIAAAMYTALDAMLPLFVIDTFHWNSLGAGLALLPILGTSFGGPIVGFLSDKYGVKWFIVAGCIVSCPCFALLRLVSENTMHQKVLLFGLLTALGTGLTLVLTPIMAEIAYAVEEEAERRGRSSFGKHGAFAQAYSLFNIAWAIGGMTGPLLGGILKQKHGWAFATLVLSVVAAVTAIPAVLWTGGRLLKTKR